MSSSSTGSGSSSSATPSSSSSSATGSSSSSGVCTGDCNWVLDEYGQWQNIYFGCRGYNCTCYEPGIALLVNPRTEVRTPCVSLGDLFPSSSSSGEIMPVRLMKMTKPGALGGLVRVSSVKAPLEWQSFGVNLSQPWRMLQLPKLGWIITFLQVSGGPAIPRITPACAPTDVVVPADKSLAASVILPEGGVFHQYWVPVLEKHRWAQLETAHWTVFFLRIPIPAAP